MKCPEGQNLIIEWQYPDEGKQIILGADNYTVETVETLAPGRYNIITRERSSPSSSWREFRASNADYNAPFTNLRFVVDRGNVEPYAQGFPELSVYKPFSAAGKLWSNLLLFDCFDRNNNPVSKIALAGQGGQIYQTQTMEFVRFERFDNEELNSNECQFKVYKDESVVLERTASDCPVVTEYCDDKRCPPGSCECAHGSVVCCHDSKTGTVVKQFRK